MCKIEVKNVNEMFFCLVPNFCTMHHLRDNDKFLFQFLYSWSGGQSFWLLITRSQVRFPALLWGFSLWGEDPRGDHGLGS
jgi:hypothetical protein